MLMACMPTTAAAQAPPADAAPDGPAPQTASATLATAREAFRLGSGLAKQGQWADALAAFERSRGLHAHAATIYNIGYCERALARYTRARAHFVRALADNAARGGGELTTQQVLQTKSFLEEIEARLVRLAVTIEPSGSALAVDGRPLELVVGGSARLTLVAGTRPGGEPEPTPSDDFDLVLDPGEHVFALAGSDGRSQVITEHFEPGSNRSLTLRIAAPERTRTARSRMSPLAGWLALGMGGAALTAGAIAGGVALSAKGDLDDSCLTPGACPAESEDDINRMQDAANLSTAGFVVGGVGLALGTTLLIISASDDDTQLEVGAGHARLKLRF
jgi:hypothetical protein